MGGAGGSTIVCATVASLLLGVTSTIEPFVISLTFFGVPVCPADTTEVPAPIVKVTGAPFCFTIVRLVALMADTEPALTLLSGAVFGAGASVPDVAG